MQPNVADATIGSCAGYPGPPMSASPANDLKIRSVARRFGRRWALGRVSTSIPSGGALLLLGPNGSGKSTLLRCIATALALQEGRIELGGVDVWAHRSHLRRDIAMLAHASCLYDDLSAAQNLQVWASLGHYQADIGHLLTRVGLPTDRADPVRTFSAGMHRRLAFARVLLKRPRLVLLDEPFSSLDPDGRALFSRLVRDIRGTGASVVIASHLPRDAAPQCAHAIVLEAGRKVWEGAASDAIGRVR